MFDLSKSASLVGGTLAVWGFQDLMIDPKQGSHTMFKFIGAIAAYALLGGANRSQHTAPSDLLKSNLVNLGQAARICTVTGLIFDLANRFFVQQTTFPIILKKLMVRAAVKSIIQSAFVLIDATSKLTEYSSVQKIANYYLSWAFGTGTVLLITGVYTIKKIYPVLKAPTFGEAYKPVLCAIAANMVAAIIVAIQSPSGESPAYFPEELDGYNYFKLR